MATSKLPPRGPLGRPDPAPPKPSSVASPRSPAGPVHRHRRAQPASSPRTPSAARPLLAIAFAALGFLLGRLSSAPTTPEPKAEPTVSAEAKTSSAAPAVRAMSAAATSTAGVALCPCPTPRPKVRPVVSRKKRPPVATPPYEAPDPTAATADALRRAAEHLGACAPISGSELRVHLEVTVSPSGEVERTRITNLEPVPADVSACLERTIGALELPSFDASEGQTFALTVVL